MNRIVKKKNTNIKDFQACYVAINKNGEIGSFAIHEGFNYTVNQNGENNTIDSDFVIAAPPKGEETH